MAGYTQRALARAVGVTDASISRWENGINPPSGDIAEQLDRALRADGELVRAWRHEKFGADLPVWQQKVGLLEERSVAIDYLLSAPVPGFLQSPSYARLVYQDGQPLASPSDIERWVASRCGRLQVLRDHHRDPVVTAVFPVHALAGVPAPVRREQASHLLNLMDGGKVHIHLLPPGTFLPGLTAPITVFRLVDGSKAIAGDYIAGNVILEVESHDRVEALLRKGLASAMHPGETRRMLKELAE
jgi:transcriptional regulator with XRE-family HTH domain